MYAEARDEADEVQLTWIVVAHQSERDLGAFLPSLVAGLARLDDAGFATELLVVDNASTDRSTEVAERLAPAARVVRHRTNLGYGAALNRACALARGRWVALSNADLLLPESGLGDLASVLARQPEEVAVVGPELLGEDGLRQLSVGVFPTLARLVVGLSKACHERKYVPRGEHRRGAVDWVTGACVFARRDVLIEVGGFDEAFFLYYEDVDLARRLHGRGHAVVYEPSIRVVHRRPHHGRALSAEIQAFVRASRRRYFRKHRAWFERAALAALALVEPLVRREARTREVPAPRSDGVVTAVRVEVPARAEEASGGVSSDRAPSSAPAAVDDEPFTVPAGGRSLAER